jgi:hypothetical protein
MPAMIEGFTFLNWRRVASHLLALSTFSVLGVFAVQAQQFSADIITRHDGVSSAAGRLSVRDGKVRIETVEHADGFFLVDPAKPSATFVRPGARVFMDAGQSTRLTRVFVPVDPDAPCRQWQAMARLAGAAGEGTWRCDQTGEETIEGRSTVAFKVVSGAGQEFAGWIDRELAFPLRIKTEDGALVALTAIKDAPQPVSSFEIPASFRKFSLDALMERIKQSDVWVAQPEDDKAPRP